MTSTICEHPLSQTSILKAEGNIWDQLVSRVACRTDRTDRQIDRTNA